MIAAAFSDEAFGICINCLTNISDTVGTYRVLGLLTIISHSTNIYFKLYTTFVLLEDSLNKVKVAPGT